MCPRARLVDAAVNKALRLQFALIKDQFSFTPGFGQFPGSWTLLSAKCVVNPVPEPSSMLLIGTGLIGLGWKFGWRKPSA